MWEGHDLKQIVDGNILNPLPAVLIGTCVEKRPNFLVIGYISPFDFGRHIFFSIFKKRYSRLGIHQNKTFSVNIPSVHILKEFNVCGTKSGRNFDKSTLFTTFYGELKTAPMIKECPLTIECKVTEILDYKQNEGIIGRVITSYASEEILKDGLIDMKLVNPIIWANLSGTSKYFTLGDQIID
ncbi:MAG: flavin reductase family protein [Candidatus Hodarchaeales archaeon]|jgi:flavin reductase (DIM6/NTAB) family NADH-FMN oxidoreductase RutF